MVWGGSGCFRMAQCGWSSGRERGCYSLPLVCNMSRYCTFDVLELEGDNCNLKASESESSADIGEITYIHLRGGEG